nr:HlyD family efflux transporter periplasmic adaptor subunit [Desulforhopalus vacuolatus]
MKTKRLRLLLVIILPFLLGSGLLLFYPLPSYTLCEGVTWAPEESRLHATATGFVSEIMVESGSRVTAGTVLLRFTNDELDSRVKQISARRDEFLAKYDQSRQKDINEAMLFREAVMQIEAELTEVQSRQAELTMTAPEDGIFILERQSDMLGHYFTRGTQLGYILDPDGLYLRVVVPQSDIEKVRGDTVAIAVRLSDKIDTVLPARIIREVPAATRELPSMALSTQGGGPFGLDPREKERPMVLEYLFQFDIQVEKPLEPWLEQRAYVRFEHHPEPLALRLYRSVRRLLLSRFSF